MCGLCVYVQLYMYVRIMCVHTYISMCYGLQTNVCIHIHIHIDIYVYVYKRVNVGITVCRGHVTMKTGGGAGVFCLHMNKTNEAHNSIL